MDQIQDLVELPFLKTEDDMLYLITTCAPIAQMMEHPVSSIETAPDIEYGITIYGALDSDINIEKVHHWLGRYAYPVNIGSKDEGEPLIPCSITLRASSLDIVEKVVNNVQRYWRLKRIGLRQLEENEDPEVTERQERISSYNKKLAEDREAMVYPGKGEINYPKCSDRRRKGFFLYVFVPSFPGPSPSIPMR